MGCDIHLWVEVSEIFDFDWLGHYIGGRTYLEHFEWWIRNKWHELAALGSPAETRLVFFFDS